MKYIFKEPPFSSWNKPCFVRVAYIFYLLRILTLILIHRIQLQFYFPVPSLSGFVVNFIKRLSSMLGSLPSHHPTTLPVLRNDFSKIHFVLQTQQNFKNWILCLWCTNSCVLTGLFNVSSIFSSRDFILSVFHFTCIKLGSVISFNFLYIFSLCLIISYFAYLGFFPFFLFRLANSFNVLFYCIISF